MQEWYLPKTILPVLGIHVLSCISGAFFETYTLYDTPSLLLYSGIILVFLAFVLLIIYAFRIVGMRNLQFDNIHNL